MIYPRIRNLREDSDIKQKQFAKILHVAQQTYSNYECGTREIPIELLIRIAEFHNTSVDYLLGLTDVKEPYPRKK